MTKQILMTDVECYGNYFLLAFHNIVSKKFTYFELHEDSALDIPKIRKILQTYTTAAFNSINYDLPLIFLALTGADNATLKKASDMIIVTGLKPWHIENKFNFKIPKQGLDHIDLIEVAPGKASLKLYGGRIHSDTLQDLPIDPSDLISPEQRVELREYCSNDLKLTHDLYRKLLPQIELRAQMSKEYGIDLRSKSDAQIAEAVISHQMQKLTKIKPERPVVEAGTVFCYTPPEFIEFHSDILCNVRDRMVNAQYVVNDSGKILIPDGLDKETFSYGESNYRIGIGGLHSCEETTMHLADDEWMLIDRDVASYYPAIILNCRLFPEHLGPRFLAVYKDIVDRRLKAKAEGNKVVADSLKITINGSFGKLGSKWSVLYSPQLLLQTTITGQLALLMLIEQVEAVGVQVVSANTDGIVMKCRRKDKAVLDKAVWLWEQATGFSTEETLYSALYSRDINNFIAIREDGSGYKVKGAYAPPEPVGSSWPNPHNQICIDAVIDFLRFGKPIAETITQSEDPRKFVSCRTVKGGAIFNEEYLGKAIRWYYKIGNAGAIHYKTNGYKVPKTEGAEPCMQIPLVLPDDMDFRWYIREAESILCDIGASLA